MLTVEEAARLFQVSQDTMRRWIRSSLVPAEPLLGVKTNGYRISAEQWVEQLEANGLPGQARMVRLYVDRQSQSRQAQGDSTG